MRAKGKKFVSLFLVFSLLALSGNLMANERRGAELVIQKVDGQQIRGELIAVKKNSLLLLNSEGADVSVDIKDIVTINVIKGSKLLVGAGLGLLIGGSAGALWGLILGSDEPYESEEPGEVVTRKASQKALTIGILFGLIGTIGGGIMGGTAGADETIWIKGKSLQELESVLKKLKSKARFPDYQ